VPRHCTSECVSRHCADGLGSGGIRYSPSCLDLGFVGRLAYEAELGASKLSYGYWFVSWVIITTMQLRVWPPKKRRHCWKFGRSGRAFGIQFNSGTNIQPQSRELGSADYLKSSVPYLVQQVYNCANRNTHTQPTNARNWPNPGRVGPVFASTSVLSPSRACAQIVLRTPDTRYAQSRCAARPIHRPLFD
jgi:hypothetical protein